MLQAQSVTMAKNFGYDMHMWTSTGNNSYRMNIINMCDGKKKARVADELAQKLAIRHNMKPNPSYTLEAYLTWIEVAIEKGMSIEFSNFKTVNHKYFKAKGLTQIKDVNHLKLVSCDMKTEGVISLFTKDIIYIRDGKISKIAKYE